MGGATTNPASIFILPPRPPIVAVISSGILLKAGAVEVDISPLLRSCKVSATFKLILPALPRKESVKIALLSKMICLAFISMFPASPPPILVAEITEKVETESLSVFIIILPLLPLELASLRKPLIKIDLASKGTSPSCSLPTISISSALIIKSPGSPELSLTAPMMLMPLLDFCDKVSVSINISVPSTVPSAIEAILLSDVPKNKF